MAISLIRTIIIYLLVLVGIRMMGKRQIGELQPFELVVAMLISDLAAVPMQDTAQPLTSGLIPLFTIIALQTIVSGITMTKSKVRRKITGNPTILIKNGKIMQNEMKRVNFTLDDLIEALRLEGYCNPAEIEFCILETNGNISVFPLQNNQPVFSLPIVTDGDVLYSNLHFFGLDENWMNSQLKNEKISLEDVFLMTVDVNKNVGFVRKDKGA